VSTTGRLIGFEALLRWNHPERGLIEPAHFLKIADRVGLMDPIGRLVVREACAQMAVWNHTTPAARHLRVAVNLAEQQLTSSTLGLEVADVLAWAGLRPGQLTVEVNEGLLGRHLEELDGLRAVADLGVGVAVDGYGTGGMTLDRARSYDMVTTVKLDRCFSRDLVHDEVSRSAVAAMVALSGPLGWTVVAEGVEEQAQLDVLRSLGVRHMQGFLFNAPAYADLVDPGSWFAPALDAREASMGMRPLNPHA
jgi:EAL domain-containing protein (putative c-di-GMP-specific phosphodiesterase class I)